MAKTERNLKTIHEHMANHIKGYIASAVVNLEDGLPVSKLCTDPEIDCDAISVYLSSIVNSHIKTTRIIPGTRKTNDISFTTDKNYFIIRILPRQQVFFYVMTEEDGRLKFKRLLMEKYEKYVIKTLE